MKNRLKQAFLCVSMFVGFCMAYAQENRMPPFVHSFRQSFQDETNSTIYVDVTVKLESATTVYLVKIESTDDINIGIDDSRAPIRLTKKNGRWIWPKGFNPGRRINQLTLLKEEGGGSTIWHTGKAQKVWEAKEKEWNEQQRLASPPAPTVADNPSKSIHEDNSQETVNIPRKADSVVSPTVQPSAPKASQSVDEEKGKRGSAAPQKIVPQPSVEQKAMLEKSQVLERFSSFISDEEMFPVDALDSTFDRQAFIDQYLDDNYSNIPIRNQRQCVREMKKMLDRRIEELEREEGKRRAHIWAADADAGNLNIYYFLGGIALSILLALVIIALGNNKRRRMTKPDRQPQEKAGEVTPQEQIIVRRKTTSILKKQSLEDVLHNDNYMQIDCAEFCADSAVRRIYLKNTCIIDIYNMYANDLRNPENPKEDGCMVLGRWVHDTETDEYYVSLEEVIYPGDDAVFKEYELNFGGKIKLRVAEKLRKLRRETDLQYDLTCWVHSHPGLGVFFSNYDNGVHMQLKHATHPKFLTAIVVDILTPDMELGIFTFKHRDMAVNAKSEITKMYSLEKMYRWAVESEHSAYRPEDYYNLIDSASCKEPSLSGICLSNGAVIDMAQLVVRQKTGIVGWCSGFEHKQGLRSESVIGAVSSEIPVTQENLGCFIIGNHLNIPSVRRLLENGSSTLKFVLFYSTEDDFVTALPMIGGQLVYDATYYGKVKLEDLKIWTRRKR